MNNYSFFATTGKGLEDALVAELTALGAKDIVPTPHGGGVAFSGNKETYYRANFSLRTAVRVLIQLATFRCETYDELYAGSKTIDWSQFMGLQNTLAVDANVHNSGEVSHSQFASRKVKDAVVDQFRDKTGDRPNVDPRLPDIKINAHIHNKQCTISLDSSGPSLHMRGYRKLIGGAPMKEHLAAALIDYSGWKEGPLYDPFCGSGTIAIEAALKSANIQPGLIRKEYGFHRWPDFDAKLWGKIHSEAKDKIVRKTTHDVFGSDIDPISLKAAMENAVEAGVDKLIRFRVADVVRFSPERPGVIVTNPPHGERIGVKEDLKPFYKIFGDVLKSKCRGSSAYVFINGPELIKSVGLRASAKKIIFNGPMECRLVKYEMY